LLKDRWKADPKAASPATPLSRSSNGLDQFFASLQERESLNILDLSGASQANITFITNLGHRIYTDDVQTALDAAFGTGAGAIESQSDPVRARSFVGQTLDFPDATFDGALVWDSLQFLGPELLRETVERLFRILRPQASLLAFFSAEEKQTVIPAYSYRIVDAKTLSLLPRGERRSPQFFNNRALEKLFQNFYSVKFFLTRDHLREVIVKR
jgi:hypothetical protein